MYLTNHLVNYGLAGRLAPEDANLYLLDGDKLIKYII